MFFLWIENWIHDAYLNWKIGDINSKKQTKANDMRYCCVFEAKKKKEIIIEMNRKFFFPFWNHYSPIGGIFFSSWSNLSHTHTQTFVSFVTYIIFRRINDWHRHHHQKKIISFNDIDQIRMISTLLLLFYVWMYVTHIHKGRSIFCLYVCLDIWWFVTRLMFLINKFSQHDVDMI